MRGGYALSPGTHICRVGESWVFLDEERDRYFCLTGPAADHFSQLTCPQDNADLGSKTIGLANRLIERGLLIATDQNVGAIEPPRLPKPHSSIPRDECNAVTSMRFIELAQFYVQFFRCSRLRNTKHRNLREILKAARQIKIRTQNSHQTRGPEVTQLTRSFQAIVPWAFTEHDACFFRSYLLLRYLAVFGVAADWTFAVRVSPFRAHCWVSVDGLILNEDIHVASGYAPILIV